VEESAVKEIKNFALGLKRDGAAVYAAIEQPWSNGMAEGNVNRLKTVKRTMYGRASFDLLRYWTVYDSCTIGDDEPLSSEQGVRCLTEIVIPLREGRRKTSMKFLRVNPSQGKGKPDPQQSILGKRSERGQLLSRGYRDD
jgi:hypothetical protein